MTAPLPAQPTSVPPEGTPRLFTAQCSYATWMACIAVVEATSVEAACEAAIEQANSSEAWKSLDGCGPTIIDAIAEGGSVAVWSRSNSVLPIPLDFREHAENERLRLVLARLLEWAEQMGGCDAPCWNEARALFATRLSGDIA